MFKCAIKDNLRLLALELDLERNMKLSAYELNKKNSEKCKDDQNAVQDIATSMTETFKTEVSKLLGNG